MRLALVMVRTLINFLLPTLRHESLTSAHHHITSHFDRVDIFCIKRGPAPDECIGVVVVCRCGQGQGGCVGGLHCPEQLSTVKTSYNTTAATTQHSRAYITGPRLRDNRMKMATFIKKLYIHNIFLSIVIRFFLQMMV